MGKCIGPRPVGEGVGFADSADAVAIVDLIVNVIDC